MTVETFTSPLVAPNTTVRCYRANTTRHLLKLCSWKLGDLEQLCAIIGPQESFPLYFQLMTAGQAMTVSAECTKGCQERLLEIWCDVGYTDLGPASARVHAFGELALSSNGVWSFCWARPETQPWASRRPPFVAGGAT